MVSSKSVAVDASATSIGWYVSEIETGFRSSHHEGPVLRALGAVLADLADLGFDAEWLCLPASAVGAPHERFRVFIAAWPAGAVADPDDLGAHRGGSHRAGRHEPAHRRDTVADTDRIAVRQQPVPDLGSVCATESGCLGHQWGAYELAIRRWETATGNPTPHPVDGHGRLAPAFAEWMMGLPAGWVTAVPTIPRAAQLKALGNGVVPQQGAAAFRTLMDRAEPLRRIVASMFAGNRAPLLEVA